MKTVKFNGQKLSVPEDIANSPLSESDLKALLGVPDDDLVFIRGQRGSQIVKSPVILEDGMELGHVSDYIEG